MDPRYRERLFAPWWAWAVMLGLAAMIGAAYGAALGAAVGWTVVAAVCLLGAALLLATAPRIEIDADWLQAGPARIPRSLVRAALPLDAQAARAERGSDARRFVLLRGWCSPRAVLIAIDDPADPHPAWLVTSRHPEELAEALTR